MYIYVRECKQRTVLSAKVQEPLLFILSICLFFSCASRLIKKRMRLRSRNVHDRNIYEIIHRIDWLGIESGSEFLVERSIENINMEYDLYGNYNPHHIRFNFIRSARQVYCAVSEKKANQIECAAMFVCKSRQLLSTNWIRHTGLLHYISGNHEKRHSKLELV